jgi:antitoxin component YwqK of YwqJK toxin-antitoxin module
MKRYTVTSFRLIPIIVMVIIISGSCNLKNKYQPSKNTSDSTNRQFNQTDSSTRTVITQKYSNGVIKAEIAVKGNKRDGLTRNYHEDGTLMSEINYVNNEKDGISRDFYPNKKIRMEVVYKHGIMQGEAKWHYETGEVYRVTPYVNGKAEGIQKQYYKDGRIKAEVPHKSGVAITGLKEYNIKGESLPMPSIVIEEQNKTAMKVDFILKMYLSNHSKNVKWFEGDLLDWKFFPKALTVVLTNSEGAGTIRYPAAPSRTITKTIYIYAVSETEMGNQLVLKKKYDLSFKR